jgi:radical SAM protein with 4Fe4S-binding SPASM domain
MKNKLKRLNLELSAHCSYTCVGCPNTYMERKKGYMSEELFKNIIDEIDGTVEEIFLWNYGESLLNPHISDIIKYSGNKQIKTILSTTGHTLSDREDISFLTYIDELILSINGFDDETYLFHQKNGNFEKIKQGLERIMPSLQNSDSSYILQTVINSKNIDQIKIAKEFAKQFGFKKLLLKSFNVMDNNQSTFDIFVPNQQKFSRYGDIKKRRKEEPCLEGMVINWNGDVNPCCWDYEGKIILGNVKDSGVFGVWDSQNMEKSHNTIKNKEYYPICIDCRAGKIIEEWNIE